MPPSSKNVPVDDGLDKRGLSAQVPERTDSDREEHYRRAIDLAPDAITISRLSDGMFFEVNQSFCQQTGFSAQEAVGRTVFDLKLFVNPADRMRIVEPLRKFGRVDGVEITYQARDGALLHNLISARAIQFKGEECLLLVATNISQLRKTQEALQESEESYRRIMELAPYPITITRLSDSRYMHVNHAFCQRTGYEAEAAIGRTSLELNVYFDPSDRERLLEEYRRQGKVDGLEVRFRGINDVITEYLISARPIRFKGDDCLLNISTDVSFLKEAQRVIGESKESYRRLVELAPDAITISSISDGQYFEVNEAFCRYTGYSREEAIGRTSAELNLYKDYSDRARILSALKEHGWFEGIEGDFKARNGSFLTLLLSARIMQFKGQSCILMVAANITERKRAEQELERYRQHLEEMVEVRTQSLEAAQAELVKREKLAVLGQLTATVSHELRNPLGVIRSSNFYLQRKVKEKDEKVTKHLRRIEEQVSMCDAIVADLLEYTRGRSVYMVKANLTPWLTQVVEQIQESENIAIIKDFCADLPPVPHDQEKMRRVIINVLNNAMQAVRDREQSEKTAVGAFSPRIIVKTDRYGDSVVIQVSDNGTGMSAETLQRAFEPLFTTRARGTGIGLANVKKIVNDHGGSVSLESRLSEGTQMTITLPCSCGPAATPGQ